MLMLTESEKRWLHGRVLFHHSCYLCREKDKKKCRYYCKIHKPHKSELREAAEFSESVAAKLAEMPFRGLSMNDIFEELKKTGKPFAWIALRKARLAVEEEMDNGLTGMLQASSMQTAWVVNGQFQERGTQMKWTSEPPTATDAYKWFVRKDGLDWDLCVIALSLSTPPWPYANGRKKSYWLDKVDGVLWYGPIPKPTELEK